MSTPATAPKPVSIAPPDEGLTLVQRLRRALDRETCPRMQAWISEFISAAERVEKVENRSDNLT